MKLAVSSRSIALASSCAALSVIVAVWAVRVGRPLSGGHAGSAAEVWADSSRSLGIAALVLGCGALPVGLVVGRRLLLGAARLSLLRVLHRTLATWSLIAIGLHLVTLLGAAMHGPSIVDLLVPFAWSYRRLDTGLGALGAWILALLGLSYHLRARIGLRRWRVAHRLIAAGLVLAVIHTVAGG